MQRGGIAVAVRDGRQLADRAGVVGAVRERAFFSTAQGQREGANAIYDRGISIRTIRGRRSAAVMVAPTAKVRIEADCPEIAIGTGVADVAVVAVKINRLFVGGAPVRAEDAKILVGSLGGRPLAIPSTGQ
jgi:hypothetical protein